MNIKRALGLGVLLYIASFVVGLVACFWIGFDISIGDPPPDAMFYVGMVAAIVLTYWFTRWYLKGQVGADASDALLFGVVAIVVGSVLDVIIFAASMGGNLNAMMLYYGDARFWMTLILILLTAVLAGTCAPRRR